jgi:hypothetical protein
MDANTLNHERTSPTESYFVFRDHSIFQEIVHNIEDIYAAGQHRKELIAIYL